MVALITLKQKVEHCCSECPLLFCIDWNGEYGCECSVDKNIKVEYFGKPPPEDCPLKTGHVIIEVLNGKIVTFKKTGKS